MDETRTERTPAGTHTTIDRTHSKPNGGSSVIWFLMGGIVVVIAIVVYFVVGEGRFMTSGSSQPTGGNVSINVESNDAPTATEPSAVAPADEAPSEIAPAPEQTETEPTAD